MIRGSFADVTWPKDVAVEIRRRIVHEERVRDVECLSSELQPLTFTNQECSGEGCVELPRSRTDDAAHAGISQRARAGRANADGIKVVPRRLVAVWIRLQLVHALTANAVQRTILTGGDRHIVARNDLEDRRETPAGSQRANRRIRKARGLGYARQIENMPAVGPGSCAVATVEAPVIRIGPASIAAAETRTGIAAGIADAVRPRVVSADGDPRAARR